MNDRTIKYVGGGDYIPGVPARDLTPVEYEEHRAAIDACPHTLYVAPEVASDEQSAEAKSRGKTK